VRTAHCAFARNHRDALRRSCPEKGDGKSGHGRGRYSEAELLSTECTIGAGARVCVCVFADGRRPSLQQNGRKPHRGGDARS
jgi:hypothetical protein